MITGKVGRLDRRDRKAIAAAVQERDGLSRAEARRLVWPQGRAGMLSAGAAVHHKKRTQVRSA